MSGFWQRSSKRSRPLERVEHTVAQEGKTGAPVHGPLNHLEFGVGALGWSITGVVRQTCHHPLALAHQPGCKLGQFWNAARLGVGDPALQLLPLAVLEQAAKRLNQVVESGQGRMGLADPSQVGLF